ncbi:MAG: hypothetical protein Q8R61_13875 [Thiobacillus sp.]|uniref:hypothetical protein n=1 Tax=Thiobacillus sp. TaxID=924 RepID=UPI0027357C43|nr:hypothetical protein [Thiobacillus sp.]MDP3586214.1 hypothetical protein [Thiobacillus sp.]
MNANIDEDRNPAEGVAASRRTLLRGVLLAGCSLLLPAALMGCDSQAGIDAADAGGGSGPAAADAEATRLSAKVSQESVTHQRQPKGEQQCDGCLHFLAASNTCQVVEGAISADNWSSMWTPRV